MTGLRDRRDAGFTLPEMLISIVITSMIIGVVAMAIVVSFRTVPDTTDRADSSIAVQGITTFLPPDVDSTEPGALDTSPGTPSGCSGADPGQNLLHLSWSEEFHGSTTNYVANYRFVNSTDGGRIVRLSCSGQFVLSSPTTLPMSARLSTTTPTVTTSDSDGDGDDDQAKFEIETASGEVVFIDAASKNPAETLPPNTTNPTTTTAPTTTVPNNPPTASPMLFTANPLVPVTFTLTASDPDGDTLTATLDNLPVGWTATVVGLDVTLLPIGLPGTYTFDFEVEDPSGADADSTVTVELVATATTTTTSTTTTTTTTTTTLPPCIVSSVVASPNPAELKSAAPSKLKKTVNVTATVTGGYCVGLTLQYDTGAPNGQYVQNLGNAAPYQVQLRGHPHGTELWSAGSHVLEVRDGFDNLLAQTTLVVSN